MKRTMSVLKAFGWYLKRPRLYPQVLRAINDSVARRISSQGNRRQAERWCEERAINTTDAIARMTGSHMAESVRETFKDVFTKAEQACRACPVEMGGAANLDLLYYMAEYLKAQKVIETGVAYGWSSLALLLSLATRDGSLLISTDIPYLDRDSAEYAGCVVPDKFKSHWELIKLPDKLALPQALKRIQRIDMCHYDSDKAYKGRTWAYKLLWKALNPGGCLISDDIADNTAFKDFCSQIDTEPIIVRMASATDTKYAGLLIKKA
jgi:predicted O-methyltransferase YrrM